MKFTRQIVLKFGLRIDNDYTPNLLKFQGHQTKVRATVSEAIILVRLIADTMDICCRRQRSKF